MKTPKNISDYTQKTIESWNEAAPIHAAINQSLYLDVTDKAFNNLNADFNRLVDEFGVVGKSVVQVCCNNGIDLLSVKNKGAGRCLGIDGSHVFIDQATDLSAAAGHSDVEFYCSDIYALPEKYQESFDVVIITVGVLNWMPDIFKFMDVCASLLVPGGHLLLEEIHPILCMYEEGSPSYIDSSYFHREPFIGTEGLDYFSHTKYEGKENFWFPHSLTDVFMSAIASHLQLKHFKELPYNIGNFCADLELIDHNPPLGINVCWQKTG
ncbi:MAG: 2-polyprenyl-3-methyl-5-hydroxy-6-metoxy-1,4-benzoquinol methylase [Oceanicoccus sp.]|jgi:2-polyprenyl-3-methyl-5-hydroxy-6-metoxy-1,4-benzoquinol methylase